MVASSIYSVVLGTAGHIDHGKSSIVRLLTGIDPDRLPEEKSRGVTIDLGFAPMKLADGRTVGIIDVPGHERFIKNMVAGASGIDLVALVIAADDSVMPQTREHLDIMTLLGLERGLVIINKIDLVEEDLVDLVEEEVRELVEGTFLEGAPVFRVSAVTGDGIDGLRAGVEEAIQRVPQHEPDGVFRMPIQRVFSSKGHGTVVTGIPVSGRIALGDRVEILPPSLSGRVRGLQAYKMTVEEARSGHSTAVNLSEVDYRDVHRGMIAATPGYFQATDMLEVTMKVLPHLKIPLRHRMHVRFHTGTAEVVGQLFLLEEKTANPGDDTFAQFRLSEKIVVAPGDRYVFRLESPMITLGGGEILDRSSWRLKTGKEYVLESLERKKTALGSSEAFVASIVKEAPMQLVSAREVTKRTGLPPEQVKSVFAALEEQGELVPGPQNMWFSKEGIELGRKRVVHALETCYDKDSYRVHVPKLEVRDAARLENTFFEGLIQLLSVSGDVRLLAGGRLSLPDRSVELSATDKACYELLLDNYRKELFNPQGLVNLSEASGKGEKDLERVQALLLDEEELIRVDAKIVLHKDAVPQAAERLRELFDKEGPFSASQARTVLGTSRKVAIPFLEMLDRLNVTRRVGDAREMV